MKYFTFLISTGFFLKFFLLEVTKAVWKEREKIQQSSYGFVGRGITVIFGFLKSRFCFSKEDTQSFLYLHGWSGNFYVLSSLSSRTLSPWIKYGGHTISRLPSVFPICYGQKAILESGGSRIKKLTWYIPENPNRRPQSTGSKKGM